MRDHGVHLHEEMLDRAVEVGYDVFPRLIAVPLLRKVVVAVRAVLDTATAQCRNRAGEWTPTRPTASGAA